MSDGPVLFCGDPHGKFNHIVRAAQELRASAVILLGDMEPQRSLDDELGRIANRVWFVHGNHDADTDVLYGRVWDSKLASRNVDGRVVVLPNGLRLAGLGGVFRETVWHPTTASARGGDPAFRTRKEHAKAIPPKDRWRGGPHRKHAGTIYPDELDKLANLRADILITHEAPGYHPNGFEILDTLAQALGAKVAVHGHHHDNIDSSALWERQGFRSYGVGLRGITSIDANGVATVIVPGDLDDARAYRQQSVSDET
jgi:predicted phosphodiesterase